MDFNLAIPEPVQWYEGMLLTPQHFQQNDIYWHHQLRHALGQTQPYCWGVIHFEYDQDALLEGKFSIKTLHAVMPDGLVINYPADGSDEPLFEDLSKNETFKEKGKVRLHLTVPVRVDAAAADKSNIQRFVSVSGKLAIDENTGERQVPVARLRPRVGLWVDSPVPAKFVSLPLIDIERGAKGEYQVGEYHPPVLRMSASDALGEHSLNKKALDLVTRIRSKVNQLAGKPDGEKQSWKTEVNERYQKVVDSMVASLPSLEFLVRSEQAHPFQLFQALAQMMGHVAAISESPIPPMLAKYNHNDWAWQMEKSIKYISETVSHYELAYTSYLFEPDDVGAYGIDIQESWPTDRLLIELRPLIGQTPEQLNGWLENATLAAKSRLGDLGKRRLLGANAKRILNDETMELRAQPGAVLFEVTNDTLEVDKEKLPLIATGQDNRFQVVGSKEGAPAVIILYVPARAAKTTKGAGA